MSGPHLQPLMAAAAAVCLSSAAAASAGDSWFATRVMHYAPAPGQFVNQPQYNNPSRALGPPTGGGTISPDNSGVVTLGGFGGSITLGFDRPILDDPRNPMGLDIIIFGNASYVLGDPNRRFAECAIIEVSRDDNHNGLADDAWYLIPGSHLAEPFAASLFTMTWDNDTADPTHGPAQVSWLPPGTPAFPPLHTWQTTTHQLPVSIFGIAPVLVNPNGSAAETEGVWGYADHTPTLLLGDLTGNNLVDDPTLAPEDFYTVPDDPLTVGISPGSGGGDAIDIAWAVDATTGAPANLDRIDFVRITNPVHALLGPVGEWSAEIDAVAIVRPAFHPADFDRDGAVTVSDIFSFLAAWFAADLRADVDGLPGLTVGDIFAFLALWFSA
ncbi:MAG: hypothetical protein KF869_02295 [Phycisphaeraceae bacterium]|nr:hypothetical protein [Phycisphaeraceae bacterium]